jgi:hypothetical protein
MSPLHNKRIVIASEAKTQFVRIDELDELYVRPKGEGHGWPESHFGRIAEMDDLQVTRRVRVMDGPNQSRHLGTV